MGFKVPTVWEHDDAFVALVHKAVIDERNAHEYGPPNRANVVFRASELGDVVEFADHDGEAGGCSRKPFFRYWPEAFPARPLDAETLMNFGEGELAEEVMKKRLTNMGVLVESQVNLGAWPRGATIPSERRGDARFPDKSRGLVRGKCDFVIKHPVHGAIPLEWKSASSYVYDMVRRSGPKSENALQAQFYAHEMNVEYGALGYLNKENGQVAIYVAPVDHATIAAVFDAAEKLKARIVANDKPDAPTGTRAPAWAHPSGSRRSGFQKLPDGPYYDRVWPCYSYAAKKKRVNACQFYAHCWGKLPTPQDKRPDPNPDYDVAAAEKMFPTDNAIVKARRKRKDADGFSFTTKPTEGPHV